MVRKTFPLNEPFREIHDNDREKIFSNDFLKEVGITMNSLVDENKDDKHVWVYDFDGKILGILSFMDVNSYFFMDILTSNELFPELCDETRPGFSLFSALEDIARNLGYSYIRLDSVSYRVEYWKSYGYEVSGTPSSVEGWGLLYPMEKKLS